MAYDEYEPGPEEGGAVKGELVRVVDTATGEERRILPFPHKGDIEAPLALRDSTFAKLATKPVLKVQDKKLRAPVDERTEIDILPSGEIYMSQVHVRRRLNDAFGPMGWALRPLGNVAIDPTTNVMYREWALVALGRVVGTAFGSTKYQPRNARMDFADAAEAVKSNALTRICKDLGIGSECWDRRWAEEWRNKYAVHVYVAVKQWDRNQRKEVPKTVDQWRRIDSQPFKGELEPVKDSPNQEAWRGQMNAWIALLESEQAKSKEVVDRLREARRGANAATREAVQTVEQVRTESRAPGGDAPAPTRAPETRTAGATTPQSPTPKASDVFGGPKNGAKNGIRPDERPYLIRECRIVQRTPGHILHKIVMLDGTEWFTFSTTVYARMQEHYARRDQIEITSHETHMIKNQQYRHLVEWRVLKPGTLAPAPEREPGQDG